MKLTFPAPHNILNVVVALAVLIPTMAVGSVIAADKRAPTSAVSHEELMNWIATTDAKLTFIGKSINPLSSRSALDTMVVYCSDRVFNVCGGACTVYSGGATCLSAPGTNCLVATNNVGFCDGGSCDGSCNEFNSCGTRLDNNFCWTPGTNSILVGAF